MNPIAELDRKYLWHPFTQMRDWLKREPIVLVEGEGAVLRDIRGREYLDANSSIWTNLHGHTHTKINAALRAQLNKIAHSSALGFANEPASKLARELIEAANPSLGDSLGGSGNLTQIPTLEASSSRPSSPGEEREKRGAAGKIGSATALQKRAKTFGNLHLSKVFFSDNGSTAMEVALKLAYEFARGRGLGDDVGSGGKERCSAGTKRKTVSSRRLLPKGPQFLSLEGAYHGDTVGAVSLGHIDLFHNAYSKLLFKTDKVMAPYCYRCPYNRAKPERADARTYRKCEWECLSKVEQRFQVKKQKGNGYAAFVFEPLIQGAAGMIPQPEGWLKQAAGIARSYGALLIADEVMTGFGRTGVGATAESLDKTSRSENRIGKLASPPIIFASHHEQVQPDLLAVAKGLTGGYLPMAATLTNQAIFDAFLGEYEEFKTFFHGHSYTGNQLGAAAALASLAILQSSASITSRRLLERAFREELKLLWRHSKIGDIRQVGLVAGIELVRNWRTREPFTLREQAGIRVCDAMARHGVLTRPIGNVIVLMPPYCTTAAQVQQIVAVFGQAVRRELGD